MLPVTAFIAALLVPLYILLAVHVIAARRSEKVAVGDGGNAKLLRRMRAHANFAEYAPFALLLLALAENLKTPNWILFSVGALLVFGRSIHAFGISQTPERFLFRQLGMGSTFIALGVLATACIVGAIQVL